MSPFANSYLTEEQLEEGETFYPLHAKVCINCFLVQLPAYVKPASIFDEYAYFSSYSTSWLQHCKAYCEKVKAKFELHKNSFVVEVASNDGYLLKNFLESEIPCMGIEPAENVANNAIMKGIPTEIGFFGASLADKIRSTHGAADLLVSKNVLAHVPDIHDFVEGYKILLKDKGVVTVEFPHLLELISNNQFDTIYHEHFSYLSLGVVKQLFDAHNLKIFEVETLNTHGGSLRVYASHQEFTGFRKTDSVKQVLQKEEEQNLYNQRAYREFQLRILAMRQKLMSLLTSIKSEGKSIIGYGAAAKGNTLLNYFGIRSDLVSFVADKSEAKQGKFLPGSRIPIISPEQLLENPPDFVFVLAWNLKEEILEELTEIRNEGTKIILAVPEVRVI
jgi:hypothetical protein